MGRYPLVGLPGEGRQRGGTRSELGITAHGSNALQGRHIRFACRCDDRSRASCTPLGLLLQRRRPYRYTQQQAVRPAHLSVTTPTNCGHACVSYMSCRPPCSVYSLDMYE